MIVYNYFMFVWIGGRTVSVPAIYKKTQDNKITVDRVVVIILLATYYFIKIV